MVEMSSSVRGQRRAFQSLVNNTTKIPSVSKFRILIITSCTGEKSLQHEHQPTLVDFRQGQEHIRVLERDLPLVRADELYTGQQHQRLMRGVAAARQAPALDVDLRVLSAGYGVVPAEQRLAPYEATFAGMKKDDLLGWARQLHVPDGVRKALGRPFDLALILLGEDYLAACELSSDIQLGGPAVFLCSAASSKKLPKLDGLCTVVVTNAETKRFACGLVGLKGEVVARVLERLAADPSQLVDRLRGGDEFLAFAERGMQTQVARSGRSAARANPTVDRVIDLPESWRDKPHRAKLSYFIPEWDDLVDPDFDFETDTHSGGSGDWSNEVYAHQMYPEPNYDGILISKVIAEKSKKKAERINRLGVHRFLRVPRDFPIMGDCGAFGYINETVPPYTTSEILDYYTRLDFDYGVSIDHLIVSATESVKADRYGLTIQNAEDFLREHRKLGLPWVPVGAVQGWDPESYAKAAKQYVAMGYDYIGLGGLVRTSTKEILRILEAVHPVVPSGVRMHLFGIARINVFPQLAKLGVTSVDSASYLRRAWMGSGGQNYFTENGFYTAIRIPEAGKSFRAKRIVSEGRAGGDELQAIQDRCLTVLREFDRGLRSVDETMEVIHEYDRLITPDRTQYGDRLRRTLEARPWKHCGCAICKKDGIDVILFRGNNRNRRRGFHNTHVFYKLVQRILAGEHVSVAEEDSDTESAPQLQLFDQA